MKKIYQSACKLTVATAIVGAMLIASTSCVNEEYDLDKEINPEINVGGTLTIPIGNVAPITLGDMLDPDEITELELLDDGSYKITTDGEVSVEIDEVSPITIGSIYSSSNIAAQITTAGSTSLGIAPTATGSFSADLSSSMTVAPSEQVEVQEELEAIYSMGFSNDVYLTLNFTLNLSGIDSDIAFDNYSIQLPKFITSSSSLVDSNNTLTLNDTFTKSGSSYTYSISIKSEGLDFTQYDDIIASSGETKVLNFSDDITCSGGVVLTANNISSSIVGTAVTGNITFTLSEMIAGEVSGIINPEIPDMGEAIDLSELSDGIDGDISLVVSDPSITLQATNPLQIPLEITSLTLQPYKNGTKLTPVTLSSTIYIAAASSSGSTTTKIKIYGNDNLDFSDSDSYSSLIYMEGLGAILDGMPDSIDFSYEAQVDKSQTHTIDLTKESYEVALSYQIDIPLSFDEFSLDYTATVDGLGGDLEDALEYVSSMALDITMENDLPLSITISDITPLDEDGNALSSLDPFISNSCTIAANGSSTITLTLSDNAAGDLAKLDGLDISLQANMSAADGTGSASFNANQEIRMSMSARIIGGININTDDM